MTESESVFYTLDTNLLMPSDLARGPWDSGYAHGGAPAGLAVALVERELKADLWITCRLSVDFYRPVPLRPLSYSIERRQGSSIAHHWITLRENNKDILKNGAGIPTTFRGLGVSQRRTCQRGSRANLLPLRFFDIPTNHFSRHVASRADIISLGPEMLFPTQLFQMRKGLP